MSPLSTSISDTDETSEDKHVPLSEEAESAANEDVPPPKLSQCSPEHCRKLPQWAF